MVGAANEICRMQAHLKDQRQNKGKIKCEPGIVNTAQATAFIKAYLTIVELDHAFVEIIERHEESLDRDEEDVDVSIFSNIAKAFNF